MVAPVAETFNATAEDWWICPCGNDPGGSGHGVARADGVPDEDAYAWQAHQTYVCWDCGRYGRQVDRDPETGLVPVGGQIDGSLRHRCQLDNEPVDDVIKAVAAAVHAVRSTLTAEGVRLRQTLIPTEVVVDVQGRRAVLDEEIAHACRALTINLQSAGILLRRLRRM